MNLVRAPYGFLDKQKDRYAYISELVHSTINSGLSNTPEDCRSHIYSIVIKLRLISHSAFDTTGYGLDGRGVAVRAPVEARFFYSPHHPDQLWGTSSLLSNGYQGLFPRG
jgi:hypothetical protein